MFSFGLGLTALFLVWYLYMMFRSQLIKYYMIIQVLLSICVLWNAIYEYIITNLNNFYELMIAWHVFIFLWAPFFVYYPIVLCYYLIGKPLMGAKKSFFKFASVLMGLSVLVPFFMQKTSQGIYHQLEAELYIILVGGFIAGALFKFYLMISSYSRIKDIIIRILILANIFLYIGSMPVIIFFYLVNPNGMALSNLQLKVSIDIFYFIRNILSIFLFILYTFRVNPQLFKKPGAVQFFNGLLKSGELLSDELKKYEKSNLTREMAQREFEKIEVFMSREKPYLDPELTMSGLSDMLSITRNRLSQILNGYRRQNFYDFISRYRVEEAKSLMKGKRSTANILKIAFDSGFNSKATFYTAFRKSTGMKPLEYLLSKKEKN